MREKQIIIEVATDGTITVEGQNFAGPECEKATKFMEDALGVTGTRRRTADYGKTPERIQQRGVAQ